MKSKLCIPLLFICTCLPAWCFCWVPQPRLVCAEYFQSKAVVVARLIRTTNGPGEFPDYFVYKLVVVKRLRGQVPQTFKIYEGNDSGRAPFDWNVNQRYLLFLEQPAPWSRNMWTIDGCGNSAPLTQAKRALKEIHDISKAGDKGTIVGMVSTDSWTTGVPDTDIRILGGRESLEVHTNSSGRFTETVPAGTYVVTAAKNGVNILPLLFSYENPQHVVIHPGGCAEIQFALPRP